MAVYLCHRRSLDDQGIKKSPILAAICTILSLTVGIPRGLSLPSGFGIITRFTGDGLYFPDVYKRQGQTISDAVLNCSAIGQVQTSSDFCYALAQIFFLQIAVQVSLK